MSDGSIAPPTASNHSLAPALDHIKTELQWKFDESAHSKESKAG